MTARLHAAAQRIGDRSHQCDATATAATSAGGRAYVLLDGIGSSDAVRDWTRAAARRLARACARHADAEAGLRAVYARYAAEPARQSPWREEPGAAAVVAVTTPGKALTIAWCGDSRAYLLTPAGVLHRLTSDHNLRRVHPARNGMPAGNRNVITSYLGATDTDDQVTARYGHPAIETATVPAEGRLLLASDGAYEPLEDSGRDLAAYLAGHAREAAHDFVAAAIEHAAAYADNATVLVADLRP